MFVDVLKKSMGEMDFLTIETKKILKLGNKSKYERISASEKIFQ